MKKIKNKTIIAESVDELDQWLKGLRTPGGIDAEIAKLRRLKAARQAEKELRTPAPNNVTPIKKEVEEASRERHDADVMYRYDTQSEKLKQRSIMQRDADQAMAEGWRYKQIDALRDAGIIRSKFDPSKWVQRQEGGKWKQVYPYGKPEDTTSGQVDEVSADTSKLADAVILQAIKKVTGVDITKEGVAEGAPELLKKEMPLHRHAEKLLAQNGVSKNDPDYYHHLNNTIKHLRQFGNIDLINKSNEQGVAEGSRKTYQPKHVAWVVRHGDGKVSEFKPHEDDVAKAQFDKVKGNRGASIYAIDQHSQSIPMGSLKALRRKQGVAEGSGGNWYIRVNGKILNDTKFKPVIFSSKDEARSHAMKLADKKRIPLSQIKLTKSWMDAPEPGVAEGKKPDHDGKPVSLAGYAAEEALATSRAAAEGVVAEGKDMKMNKEEVDESKIADSIRSHPAVEYYGGKDDHHMINLKPGYIHTGLEQHSFANNNASQAKKELKDVNTCDCPSCKNCNEENKNSRSTFWVIKNKETKKTLSTHRDRKSATDELNGLPADQRGQYVVVNTSKKPEDWKFNEAFDRIEEMVESFAREYNIDAELIWEEFEKVSDRELMEAAAWQTKKGKNKNGGLNKKGVASYRRQHPGSKLQTAVTTKPSKLKKGSKAAKRRKSFCARMKGMKKKNTGSKTARDPNSRINKSLRKWNC